MGEPPLCACVDFPPHFLTYRKKKHSTDNCFVRGMLLFVPAALCSMLDYHAVYDVVF